MKVRKIETCIIELVTATEPVNLRVGGSDDVLTDSSSVSKTRRMSSRQLSGRMFNRNGNRI